MSNIFKSIRLKLFFTICIVIIIIMLFLIVVNNAVLETFFYYQKNNQILDVIESINELDNQNFESKLDYIGLENDFDLLIVKDEKEIYSNGKKILNSFKDLEKITYDVEYNIFNKSNLLYAKENTIIRKITDSTNGIDFIVAESVLDNGNELYIRVPISIINESLKVSSEFLLIISFISLIGAAVYVFILTNNFTKPILNLKEMTNQIKNLNFSDKYIETSSGDEINDLGKNINDLSKKLQDTINQLRKNNIELEKDIEEKSKIDEMRKQFISDVSHELKTPIALIQGYAEGLIENVNTDEESKNFYSSVILDEANKMDKLVKRLLELMKLEYNERNFNDTKFNIVELIDRVIRNSKVITDEQEIDIKFKNSESCYVFADEFYIEQVISNYYTNAIKNIKKINGQKIIKIEIEKAEEPDKIRIKVFNTGDQINDDELVRIWNRFYKVDKSRNRLQGGTGIGLSLVKAIMLKYNNKYGVINKNNGVEFYFEINLST